MNLVALTVIKNGALRAALQKLRWTQADLARRANVTAQIVSNLALLKKKPSKQALDRIQFAFGEVDLYVPIEELWPEGFEGFKKTVRVEQYKEVATDHLVHYYENQLQLSEDSSLLDSLKSDLRELLSLLKPEAAAIMTLVFEGASVKEIAETMHCSNMHVATTIRKSVYKLQEQVLRDDLGNEVGGTLFVQLCTAEIKKLRAKRDISQKFWGIDDSDSEVELKAPELESAEELSAPEPPAFDYVETLLMKWVEEKNPGKTLVWSPGVKAIKTA